MAGSNLVLVAVLPTLGRVYLDRAKFFAGSVAPYLFTGYGQTSELSRVGAAAVLRDVPRADRISFHARGA